MILLVISSGLSIIGSLITFITYAAFRDIQTTSRHIIVCISIADFLTVTANLFGLFSKPNKGVDVPCQVQSFIGSTFVLSSFLWTVMLGVYLYITLVKENQELAEKLARPWFHILCWLLPLLINVVAINLQVLGNSKDDTSSGWCWIDLETGKRDKQIMWMIIDGKGIEILSYVLSIILYTKIKLHIRKKIKKYERVESSSSQFSRHRTVSAAKNTDRKLIFIPICLILLRIWGTIRFFVYVHGKDHYSVTLDHILLYMQAIGDNLQGAVNCILFCFLTPKVFSHIRDSLKYCCMREKTALLNTEIEASTISED